MKNNINKIFLCSTLVVLVILNTLSSCHKNDLNRQNNNNIITKKNNTRNLNCQNIQLTEDEINSVGIMHNELLDKVINNFDYSKLSSMSMYDLCKSTFINTNYKNSTTLFKTETFESAYIWRNNNVVDGNVKNYMNSINNELESTKSFNEIASYLENLKIEINNNPSLNLNEKQAIKIGISVALNSAQYWLPLEYGGNGIGYAKLISINSAQGNTDFDATIGRAKAGHIAGADLAGACAGGIEWCGAAIFGGPAGVGAFVGGCLYGAASASLFAWGGI